MTAMRVAVLGVGNRAQDHLRTLSRMEALCRLVGVCDVDPAALDQLAEKYGIYEDTRKVIDYHTLQVEVPGGLFRNAQAPGRGKLTPALEVQVKCEDRGQYLGVARSDLYLLEADGSFSANFFKGAVGLRCRLCLVIGVAVACSTFLTGVVSWLLAMFLYGAGLIYAATGSVTTVARDLFVPSSHIIPMSAAMIPQGLSQANTASPLWSGMLR